MDIFESRPFQRVNAENFKLEEIFKLFVNPMNNRDPFSFESTIIKGEMGTGKTMFLRANYAVYRYQLLHSLINDEKLIIPIYIKLSDFSSIEEDPFKIYQNIILALIKGISGSFKTLCDTNEFSKIHSSILKSQKYFNYGMLKNINSIVTRFDADKYTRKLTDAISATGKLHFPAVDASIEYEKNNVLEISERTIITFSDLVDAYKGILREGVDKILFLFDEAGSLSNRFFEKSKDNQSYFEILMNQLRTLEDSQVKIAIYPHTGADKINNVKFGKPVELKENIYDFDSYMIFRKKIIELVNRYLDSNSGTKSLQANDIFDISENSTGDAIEQLIFASSGVMRYFVYYSDLAMINAMENKEDKISKATVLRALAASGKQAKERYSPRSQNFLNNICRQLKRNKSTYKFTYTYKSIQLQKFIDQNDSQSIIRLYDNSSKKQGTIYAFEYAFCISENISTHLEKNSQKIDRERSYANGIWNDRVATISDTDEADVDTDNKMIGIITLITCDKCIVCCEESQNYILLNSNIIEGAENIKAGAKVEFYPAELDGSNYCSQARII
jgi:hypothetical protein